MTTTQKPTCPYCSMELDNPPKKKSKCPHCGNTIYVRKGQLLTEEEAYITDELVRLARFNITRNDFDQHRQILTQQFGPTASVNDTLWRIFNDQLTKTRDPDRSLAMYYEMGRLASMENKDPNPYIKQALAIRLNELKKRGVKTLRVVGYGMRSDFSSCPKCQSLHGQQFPIDVALKELPVPSSCVDKMGCRCSYISEEEWKSMHL